MPDTDLLFEEAVAKGGAKYNKNKVKCSK